MKNIIIGLVLGLVVAPFAVVAYSNYSFGDQQNLNGPWNGPRVDVLISERVDVPNGSTLYRVIDPTYNVNCYIETYQPKTTGGSNQNIVNNGPDSTNLSCVKAEKITNPMVK